MKKQITLAVACLVAGFTACQEAPTSYTISGTLPQEDSFKTLEGKYVYLHSGEGNQKIDSAKIENGSFKFAERQVVDSISFGRLRIKEGDLLLHANAILEAGTITVDLVNDVAAKGTPLNEAFFAYQAELEGLRSKAKEDIKPFAEIMKNQEATEEAKAEATKKYEEIADAFYADATKVHTKAFEANTNNVIGTKALMELLRACENLADADALLAKAGEKVAKNKAIEGIYGELKARAATMPGNKFADFADDNKAEVKLSNYVGQGHYVLVDFWASWCGPCRQEIPNLRKIYAEFKDKGLEIVGTAVWDKMDDHLKAVSELEITWPQIFNEKEATKLYGINGIPQIILFAPDGTIVERDLRGEAIKAKLDEILAKEGKL